MLNFHDSREYLAQEQSCNLLKVQSKSLSLVIGIYVAQINKLRDYGRLCLSFTQETSTSSNGKIW